MDDGGIKVYILFTGGWDSTFRLLQLASLKNVSIYPVYVIDPGRKGRKYEYRAMKSILAMVSEDRQRFPAEIRPVKRIRVESILRECADQEINDAFDRLSAKYHIGIQYRWFALLMKKYGIRMECGALFDHKGSRHLEILVYGEGGEIAPVEGDVLPGRMCVHIDKDSDTYKVFGNLILGLDGISKVTAKDIAVEKGWMPIMEKTWFCHAPVFGKPCGVCGPCQDAMNEGMEWRLPESAKRNYKHRGNLVLRGFIWLARRIPYAEK